VSEPTPSRIIRQYRRDLRECEDEDEVEEELERSDALLTLGVLLAHSRTLAGTDRDCEFAHCVPYGEAPVLTGRSSIRRELACPRKSARWALVATAWPPRVRLEGPRLVGKHDCLDAVAEIELPEDVRDVCLDGGVADVELLRDLPV